MIITQASDFDGVGVLRGDCVIPNCTCQCYQTEENHPNVCGLCQHASALHANLDQKVGDYRDAFSYYAPEPSPLENKRYVYNNESFKAYEGVLTEVRIKVILYGKCNAKGCDCEGFERQEGQSEGDRVMAFHRGSCCPHRAFVHKPIGSEEVTTQVDIRDILRGKCTVGDCCCDRYTRLQFQPESNRRTSWHWCTCCFHSPVHHINLGSFAINSAIKVKLMSENCDDSECDCTGFTTQEEGDDVAWKTCEYCEHTGVRHHKLIRQHKQPSQRTEAIAPINIEKTVEMMRAKEVHMEEICPDEDMATSPTGEYAQPAFHKAHYDSKTQVTNSSASPTQSPSSKKRDQTNEALIIDDISDENEVEYDKSAMEDEQNHAQQVTILTEIIEEGSEESSSSSSSDADGRVEITEIRSSSEKVSAEVHVRDSDTSEEDSDKDDDIGRKRRGESDLKHVSSDEDSDGESSSSSKLESIKEKLGTIIHPKSSSSESSDSEKSSKHGSNENVEIKEL